MIVLLNNIVWLSLVSRRRERMIELMCLCMHIEGNSWGSSFVVFLGIIQEFKIQPTKTLYSAKWA